MNRYIGVQTAKVNPTKVRSGGDIAMGAGEMAATGAAAGSVVGPWGTVIGGAVGGAVGLASGFSGQAKEKAINSAQTKYNLGVDALTARKEASGLMTQAQAKHGVKNANSKYVAMEYKEIMVTKDGSFHDTTKPGTSHEGVEDTRKVVPEREASQDPKNTIPEGGAVIPAQSNPKKYARIVALAKAMKAGDNEAGKEVRKEVSKLPKDK